MNIVLECHGRLANQILCWANARHLLAIECRACCGRPPATIVIDYDMPIGCLHFPQTIVARVKPEEKSALPKVTRNQLRSMRQDCLWIWEDIFSNFPPDPIMRKHIRSIELLPGLQADIINAFTGQYPPYGIHARFGDYVKPGDPSSPFIRASEKYFLDTAEACLRKHPNAKFFLASDGTDEELKFLTDKLDVIRGQRERPVFDLFALSQCRMIIGSNSTFTSVAAMYGEIPYTHPEMNAELIRHTIAEAI